MSHSPQFETCPHCGHVQLFRGSRANQYTSQGTHGNRQWCTNTACLAIFEQKCSALSKVSAAQKFQFIYAKVQEMKTSDYYRFLELLDIAPEPGCFDFSKQFNAAVREWHAKK